MRENHSVVLAILLSAALSGCGNLSGNPAEAVAVAAVHKLGGKVEYNDLGPDRRVIKVYLHNTTVRDADLAALQQLPKLRNLFLGKTEISDAGLEFLERSSELQTLALNSTRITDQGLKFLSKLTKLKTLNLQDTQVTAEGAASLKQAIPGATVAR